jgi:hypothetical protein
MPIITPGRATTIGSSYLPTSDEPRIASTVCRCPRARRGFTAKFIKRRMRSLQGDPFRFTRRWVRMHYNYEGTPGHPIRSSTEGLLTLYSFYVSPLPNHEGFFFFYGGPTDCQHRVAIILSLFMRRTWVTPLVVVDDLLRSSQEKQYSGLKRGHDHAFSGQSSVKLSIESRVPTFSRGSLS